MRTDVDRAGPSIPRKLIYTGESPAASVAEKHVLRVASRSSLYVR